MESSLYNSGPVSALSFDDQGHFLISYSADNASIIWNLFTGTLIRHCDKGKNVALSSTSKLIAYSFGKIYDLEDISDIFVLVSEIDYTLPNRKMKTLAKLSK